MYSNKLVACIAVNKKIVREDNDIVRLPFGSDYQIYIKNENSTRALVDITIDGKHILEGRSIVLNPGEGHYVLTRVESSKHYNLKFIEKTAQISAHRGDKAEDGLVKISYQFLKQKEEIKYTYTPIIEPWPTSSKWDWIPPQPYTFCSTQSLLSEPNINVVEQTLQRRITDGGPGGQSANAFYSQPFNGNPNASFGTSSASLGQASFNCNYSGPVNESGITVNGKKRDDVSYQSTYINENDLESTTHVMILQLLGEDPSKKAVTQVRLTRTKVQCPICGTPNNSGNKFCANCGNCLEL